MKFTQRALVVLATVAFLFIAHSGLSAQAEQQPSPAQPGASTPQAPRPSQPAVPQPTQGAAAAATTAEGELIEVDAKAKMITVKTAAGPEMEFKYDDSTKVTGGQKEVAGLATATGSQVTISFKKDGATNMATSIQVRPAAAGAAPPRSDSPLTRPADPSKPVTPK